MDISTAVFRRSCFLGDLHTLWLLQIFYFLFHTVPRPEGRNFMEISHLGLSVSASLTSAYCLRVGLYVCSCLVQEEDTLMMAEQSTVLSIEDCP